jgi:23S rRNA (uracil1939-C5)-methyltransferase
MNTICTDGCSEFAFNETPPLFLEAKKLFEIPFELVRGSPTQFRTRAKLAVRKEGIGLFKRGTHTVIPMTICLAHHPKLNEAFASFKTAFSKSSFTPYDEVHHTGDIRYIQLIVERSSNNIMLSLVLNNKARLNELKTWCEKALPFSSVSINVQTEKTNSIFSNEWHHVFGPEYISEVICGNEFFFGPSHFGQANLELFEKLIFDLQKNISADSHVLEVYGGIGVIGLSIASKCASVTISEREKSAEKYFQMALKNKKAEFKVVDSLGSIELLQKVDTVIVDPPRKGLEPQFLDAVIGSDIKKLIYVSCGFPSFERDMKKLLLHGFKITFAKSYLFFPGTNHIELLAVFER